MFDWLFGSGRETNYDDLLKNAQATSRANADTSSFYNDNIADGKWEGLDDAGKASILSKYNGMKATSDAGNETYKGYLDAYNQEDKDNRYNYFGNGILGTLLNPIGQTASAVKDLATGQYDDNKRDLMSDLGAAGETALTFIPGVGLASKAMKAGKVANGLTKAGRVVNSIPGMAATGAGIGATDELRRGGGETELGDVAGSALMGGLLGGAVPLAGRVGGNMLRRRGSNVLTREMGNRGMDQGAIDQTMGALPSTALYQTALKSLVPRSTVGKLAVGGGALYGGNALLNGGGAPVAPQAPMDPSMMAAGGGNGDQVTDEQMYNYLQSMGYI